MLSLSIIIPVYNVEKYIGRCIHAILTQDVAGALTRCRKQLSMSREKWTPAQEKRAKILFGLYPKLEEAYNLINSLRAIFRNKELTRETAREKFGEWYGKVAACTLREIKSVRDTVKFYEDEILNYFIKRQTNASAESLNSKINASGHK